MKRMMKMRWGVALGALGALAAGCGEASLEIAPAREARAQALGEPIGDYPSHQERVVLYLTNRARAEPAKYNPDDPYDPSPPLRWDLQLSKAARFHAEHILADDCWCEDHSSCCELTGQGDETTCAGASSGCGVTDASDRVTRWSSAYSAENMARGQRSASEAVDGWIQSPGHWANINGAHTLLGVGRHETAWVQDFGRGGRPAFFEDGVHFQQGGAHTFGISYYQPGTGGPQEILVILDGECLELELAAGEPDHGAFERSRQLAPGCHRYYFYVRDGDGADHVYPTEGSFGVAVGDAAGCPLYDTNRPADTCSPAGETCETGVSRPCYTGPYGTEGVGVCEAGTERCIGAQWTGECNREVLPSSEDACGDAVDNDCDGVVDEGCADEDDAQTDSPDMGAPSMMTPPDDADGDPSQGGDTGGEGCAQSAPGPAAPGGAWLLALLGLWRARRGRTRRDR